MGSKHASRSNISKVEHETTPATTEGGEYGTYKDQVVIVQHWSKVARLNLSKNEWIRLKAVITNGINLSSSIILSYIQAQRYSSRKFEHLCRILFGQPNIVHVSLGLLWKG